MTHHMIGMAINSLLMLPAIAVTDVVARVGGRNVDKAFGRYGEWITAKVVLLVGCLLLVVVVVRPRCRATVIAAAAVFA